MCLGPSLDFQSDVKSIVVPAACPGLTCLIPQSIIWVVSVLCLKGRLVFKWI